MEVQVIQATLLSGFLKVFAVILCALVVCVPDAGAQQAWVPVCTDAGAGGYEAFPDVCRLADGRLMAVFYAGYGHVSLPNETLPNGGRISFCTSADEGQTWSAAQTLFDGSYDDRDPSVTQLKDGRLICTFFTLKPTGGTSWVGLGTFAVTSADGGVTWDTAPQQISTNHYCSSPVRELPDGRFILGLYWQTTADAWGAVTISENGGVTWGAPVTIPNGGLRLEAETDVIRRLDGSLFAALRGATVPAWSVSNDGGLSWSVAQPFGFPGHCHYLHRTPDDIILMAHRLPNTSLHYSLDECQTWSTNIVVDTVTGAYPSMVTLTDGSTLIVYYEEGTGSNIRAKRFRVTPSGFDWLEAAPGWAVTRTFLNSSGGLWTNTANWSGGTLPAANEIANLSAATGTIDLTADVTVGEIFYNPVFSGMTNTLTLLSDTAAPSSKKVTLTTALTNHVQVGEGAELRLDADLKLAGNVRKDGQGTLVIKRRLPPTVRTDFHVEQGRLVNEGMIALFASRMHLGTVEPDAGPAPEFVMREGSSYYSTTGAQGSDLLWGGNRLLAAGTGSRAVVTHEGGTLDLTTNATGGVFLNGYAAGGSCVYNLSGGEVNLRTKTVYPAFNGTGTVNQTGGRFLASAVNFTSAATGYGTYNLTGGELWLGGGVTRGGGTAAFNLGGGRLYPFNAGFTVAWDTYPKLTGVNGLTRFCSADGGFTNTVSGLTGTGGFVKEGADTLNLIGTTHTFSGPVIVSNGAVHVAASMTGGNDVTVAGGSLNLNAGASALFSSLTVTGGVFQISSNSVLALKSADPWARVGETGTVRLLDGSKMLRLDAAGSGVIELAGGTATVYRVRIGGAELANGYYTAADSASITGPGLLDVSFQNERRSVLDTFSRPDGPAAGDSLGRTEEPGGTDWSEFPAYAGVGHVASIVNGELRLGVGTSDPNIALAAASWPNGDFATRMRFNRVGASGASVKNGCGLILRRNVTIRTGIMAAAPGWAGAIHVQMTAAGGLFLRENYSDNRYAKNPFTGSADYLAYGAAGSLPASVNGHPFDADGDGRLGDDEPFELRALLSGHRLQVLINGEPVMAHNGFAATSTSEENGAGFWKNRLSSANFETHDSYHDSFSVSNLPFVIRHVGAFDPNIAAPAPRENWTLGPGSNTNAVPVGPVTETIGGETVKAWRVDDASTSTLAHYLTSLSDSEVAAANEYGWRLTMRLRVVNSGDAPDGSVSGQVSTDSHVVSIIFGSDASGNARVQVTNGNTHTVPGGSVYHTYELAYDPGSTTLSLTCDGTLLQAGIVKQSGSYKRVLWGANQSASTGCGHFESVRFSILWPEPPPPPVPPPPTGTVMRVR